MSNSPTRAETRRSNRPRLAARSTAFAALALCGNFVNAEMVKAFISSDEYRARFSAPLP